MRRRLALAAVGATALLVALVPGAATAGNGDRNKDRIPDRWEKAHKLSLKVKQTNKDQDRDGLRNLAEWRNHSDPRDADSDNDGLDDGDEVKVGLKPSDRDSDDDGRHDDDENAGTIQSFAAGKLTIALAGGDTLTATVVDGVTEIECESDDAPAPTTAPVTLRSRGDNAGRDHDDDDNDGDHGDDDDSKDDDATCTAASLTVGAVVHEAEVKTKGGQAVFTEIEVRVAA
jgi:hypothetical protein